MGAITLAGTGSGLDLESIISTFVQAERIPTENRLNKRELELNAELSGVGTFKAELSKFQSVLEKLSNPDSFGGRSVTFSDGKAASEQPLSISTTSSAAAGNFSVDVQQLAAGTSLTSAALGQSTDPVGNGTLTFGAGTNTFQVSVGAADTLEDIRDAINSASDNFGVSANIINSDAGAVLTLESSVTGDANNLTITADDDSLASIATSAPTAAAGLTQTQAAQSAQILVNGQLSSSDTNEFKNVIQGSTITLGSSAKVGDSVGFEVATDKDSVKTLVDEFISGYNTLMDKMDSLSNPKNGSLAFDPSIRQVQSQLSTFTSQEVGSATGSMKALYDIGITVDRDGRLEINQLATVSGSKSGQDRFDEALNSNFDEITTLFSASDGIATVANDYVELFTKSKGVLSERQDSINSLLDNIEKDREDLTLRLTNLESTLRLQYTALDQTMAQYNATSSYLSSVLTPQKNDS